MYLTDLVCRLSVKYAIANLLISFLVHYEIRFFQRWQGFTKNPSDEVYSKRLPKNEMPNLICK